MASTGGMLGEKEHFVHFYDNEAVLIGAIGDFIAPALELGQAGIVILTPAHRQELERALKARNIDLAAAAQREQYIALDAADTLSKFMIDGWPDEQRFVDVVGGLFARLGSRYPRVRAFGEMVTLLWKDQKPAATIRLEQLWNNLGKIHPFHLMCAYPMNGFVKEVAGSHFRSICAEHSRAVPLGSTSG